MIKISFVIEIKKFIYIFLILIINDDIIIFVFKKLFEKLVSMDIVQIMMILIILIFFIHLLFMHLFNPLLF